MYFYYAHGAQEVNIVKMSENGWNHCFLGWTIQSGALTEIFIEILTIRDGSMGMGAARELAMGCNSYKHPSLLTYLCRDGSITAHQPTIHPHNRVKPRDMIRVRVNRQSNKINWFIGQQMVGETDLTIMPQNEPLYFVVTMFWKGDSVRVHL